MGMITLRPDDVDPEVHQTGSQDNLTPKSAARSGIGTILDVVGPIAIQLAGFFGAQAYVDSTPGPFRIQFGAGMFLRMLIPSLGIYFFLVKPALRLLVPKWWPHV